MTVSSTSNRKTFTGDGVTVAFGTSPVVFFDAGDLKVYKVVTATGAATLQTITTDYTVSGGAGSTGTVTCVVAPTAAQTLVIVRELDLVQEVDFVNNEATDAEVAEDALDKLTMMAQQLSARLDRSFTLPDSDISGASTEVPTPVANTLVGWNAAGTALENKVPADLDLAVVTAFIDTLLDDSDAAAAQATLLLGTKSTVACAATTADIWTGTGTFIDFTGSTGPVTAFPAAPRAGIQRVLLCASTPTFTHGANLVVPGSANYTAAAGDIIVVTAETTTKFRLSIFKADGSAVAFALSSLGNQTANTFLAGPASGAAATPAFRAPVGADGASLVLIETQTASNAATVDFDSGITSTYDEYIVVANKVIPQTDNTDLLVRVSVDGGSNYLATNEYNHARNGIIVGTGNSAASAAGATSALAAGGLGTGTGEVFNGSLRFRNLADTSVYKTVDTMGTYHSATPATIVLTSGAVIITTSAVNAIRLLMSSGNINGTFSLYGVRKA